MEFDVIQHEQTPVTPEIKDVQKFIEENKEKIEAFREYAISREDGIGLAANQCSLDGERFNLRMIAVKDAKTGECTIAIDPKARLFGIERMRIEGCLTWKEKEDCPGSVFAIIAKRHHFAEVEFYTPEGDKKTVLSKGFQAQVWQHELNHINGIEEDVVEVKQGAAIAVDEDPDANTQRNDKCPCGSGKKYKQCCIQN